MHLVLEFCVVRTQPAFLYRFCKNDYAKNGIVRHAWLIALQDRRYHTPSQRTEWSSQVYFYSRLYSLSGFQQDHQETDLSSWGPFS